MGDWMKRKVEENEVVGMNYCGSLVGGGRRGFLPDHFVEGKTRRRKVDVACCMERVGGGGWVGGWRSTVL